jgi:hypothetical protein
MTKIIVTKITNEIMLIYNQLSKTAKVFRNGKFSDHINFPCDYTPEKFEEYVDKKKKNKN